MSEKVDKLLSILTPTLRLRGRHRNAGLEALARVRLELSDEERAEIDQRAEAIEVVEPPENDNMFLDQFANAKRRPPIA
jgi:hypothetical protein